MDADVEIDATTGFTKVGTRWLDMVGRRLNNHVTTSVGVNSLSSR